MKIIFTKRVIYFILLQFMVLLIVSCNAEKPETIVIRETVIVEIPATVIVTQRPTTVEVEVTRIIEIPVTVTKEKPVATPTQIPVIVTPSPTFFEPYPYGDYTDIQWVDEIARTILSKNTIALRGLLRFHSEECWEAYFPYGPTCNEDESVGTLVEAFSYSLCEGYGTRDEGEIASVLEYLVADTTGVYAIYEEEANKSYGIIFTSINNIYAIEVLVEDGGINSVSWGCATSPDDFLLDENADVILPPVSTRKNNENE